MMSEKSGPLESGSREVRFVVMDDHGVIRAHADTLAQARERRDTVQAPDGHLHVIRERREVVPDGADAPGDQR